jgi:hypothetical protein
VTSLSANYNGDIPMNKKQTTRRRFLVAAITFSTVASGVPGSSWLTSSAAWADTAKPTDEFREFLAQLARQLFPHDKLTDDVYAEVMGNILATTAADPAISDVFDSAEAALDIESGRSWIGLDSPTQVEVMARLQDESFFAAIVASVRFNFYTNPDVWHLIDYPGSSKEFGGYINRGFDDIDWLPEGT